MESSLKKEAKKDAQDEKKGGFAVGNISNKRNTDVQ